jgi:predicted ATP-binding protein involved in virulence
MKVCYLWVEKFRNLENFEINLSSEHDFHYNKLTHTISRKNKNKLPDNFFYDGISDVAAFIGENGSGKSNCIEFICMVLKSGKTRVKSDFIIITEDDGYYTSHQKFNKKRFAASSDFEVTNEIYERGLNGINVIYFSNVSDDRQLNFHKSISNISINSKDYQSFKFSNQLSFMKSDRFKSLEIEQPEYLKIEIKYYSTGVGYIEDESTKEKLVRFTRLLKNKIRGLSLQSQFSEAIKYAIIFKLLRMMISELSEDLFNDFIIKNLYFEEKERTEIVSNRILSACINHPACKQIQKKSAMFFILEKLEYNELALLDEETRAGSSINFLINYNNTENKAFVDKIVDFFDGEYLIRFAWWGLSSGHAAYLTLFSSIYCELKRTRNDAIILIDEGDLYLHPKWQIEFFEKLVTVLPNLSSGDIQLVLTSHSPFLLSDLPSQCITILKTDNYLTKPIQFKSMTFGANLYELYSDIFFIGNKRTGTFAQKKIEDLLNEADKSKNSTNLNEKIKLYKNIIGDKIINHNLSEILKND